MRSHRGNLAGLGIWLGAIVMATGTGDSHAQQEPAVLTGVQFLKGHCNGQPPGQSAMIALALIKAELPAGDPSLSACVAAIRNRFTSSSYEPARQRHGSL